MRTEPLSSGRWDASGSWQNAVFKEREKAFIWAKSLPLKKLHWAVTVMSSDVNAFTLYERKALLEVIALRLGREIQLEESDDPFTIFDVEINKDHINDKGI